MKLWNAKTAAFLLLPLLTLTGCSIAATNKAPIYTDANFNEMTQDIENVICDVKGKQIMEEEDVENFRALTARLDTYKGSKKQEVSDVAAKLNNISDNWSASLGIDLGEENGKMLTNLCTKMENQ